jgi:hypothetical protein
MVVSSADNPAKLKLPAGSPAASATMRQRPRFCFRSYDVSNLSCSSSFN